MVMGRPRLPRQVEREFWRLIAKGSSTESAAEAVGVSFGVGRRWFRDGGGMTRVDLSEPTGRYLSMSEREDIAVWRGAGVGVREIARRLGRAPSTISRELGRNTRTCGRPYRAGGADHCAHGPRGLRPAGGPGRGAAVA